MPRKYFSSSCKHIYGYVLPSATEKLRLQKGDLTRVERVCLGCFSSSLNGFQMYAWSYKLFKPCIPIPASHPCLTVNSNETFSWPQVGWNNKSPLVSRPGKWKWLREVYWDVSYHRGLQHCWANATGEGILHSEIPCSVRARGWTHNLDYPAKKHLLLARDGKETFLIPDTAQTLYSVGEIVLVASWNVNPLLWLNDKKEVKTAILSTFNSRLHGKYLKLS